MKKNLKYVYYRHPRTRQEARANQEGWERAKRRPIHLPDTYDDLWTDREKSWKATRKTQYHPGGRGKEHSIEVDPDWTYEWDLSEYFKKHNIPYRIERVCESRMRKFRKTKRVSKGIGPVYKIQHYRDEEGQLKWVDVFSHFTEKYEWVNDGYEWKSVIDVVAYRIIWWSDKDIGIDYILKQCRIKWTFSK
jgi:hypothetical protein